MQVQHIDNSFFYLTASQAKDLCIDGKLPSEGCQKKADPEKVKKLKLVYKHQGLIRNCLKQPTGNEKAWIQKTPLTLWEGKSVKNNWVWSIFIYFSLIDN